MESPPLVSFVIATQNRRDLLLSTLDQLHHPERSTSHAEIIVTVNPSSDATCEAIRATFSEVQVLSLERNLGSCAKALGARRAAGRYVVFLDDDSCPRPGCVESMVDKFSRDDRLGAAGFLIHLPDGRRECSALPSVFVGCGVGIRREALEAVGGLDESLFMQAEEYDLSFRLVAAGWDVTTFTDLAVDHLKTPKARVGARTVYYDTRNNSLLTARYLPDEYEAVYRNDWLQRYGWIAAAAGHRWNYWCGRLAAAARRRAERRALRRWRLSPSAMETIFALGRTDDRMRRLADSGARRIVLAGLGKNVYPFATAAACHGLEILAIADDRFAATDRRYRGHPILPLAAGLEMKPDAVVISNTSPVHAEEAHARLAEQTSVPIHRWFGYDVT